jgi:tyrosinase
MYLYYFEKIVRRAANDLDLTIPYWDYFDPDQRVIPEPFRIPSDPKSNPLYVDERCSEMNHGKPLPTEIVNHDPALSSSFFTVNKNANAQLVCHSFGSAETDELMFDSDGHGVLEQMPHNQIHLFVGGPNGFMSDNCRASRDPIFWLHHAQIDRIWETWLKEGGKNVDENKWLNQSFEWFDENGIRKSHKVGDFMDTAKQLNYTYDKLIDTDEKNEPKLVSIPNPKIIAEEYNKANLVVRNTSKSILLSINEEGKDLFD